MDTEQQNIVDLTYDLSNFINSKDYSKIEKTYALLYTALALNLDSQHSIDFLDEAFNCEVLPMAKQD